MENNKVSIIVPIFNSEKWMKKCIDSIIEQSYKLIEIILVDDGSVDKSPEICDEYASKDERVHVIHKKNEGVSIARNTGIDIATGKYVKFVDSDDWIEKDCCEKLVNIMEKEKVDLVICGLNIFQDGKLLRNPHLDDKKIEIKNDFKYYKYISKIFASPCNKLYKREKIKKKFEIKQSSGEDLIFNLNYLLETNKVYTTHYCLYNVRLDNPNSLNRKFREDRFDIVINLIQNEINFCKKIYGDNYEKQFFANMYIENLHAHLRNLATIYKYKEFKIKSYKYINLDIIKKATKMCHLKRKDYEIFNKLLKIKSTFFIYLFFKIKFILVKIIR